MATANEVVKKALSQKGNKGTKYWNAYGVPKGTAWCVIFVWWCFRECKASSLFFNGKKTAYVPAVDDWGKKDGLIVKKNNGKKGDIVIFDWGNDGTRDHVGFIVEKVSGGYKTIEGNTSGGIVAERTRSTKDILHLIRPKYAEEKTKYNLKRKLKRGCYGDDVAQLQKALNKALGTKLKIDKSFGPATEKALIKYQKSKGWKPSGVVRTKTAHSFGWKYKGK